MNRLFYCLPSLSLCSVGLLANNDKPNILVIYADDMGWGDVGFHGYDDVETPNIDALARGGVQFPQAYVTASVSGPSRAGVITGVYQQRFGYYGNSELCTVGMPTLGEYLQEEGYATGLMGKWHLGKTPDQVPHARGFDFFYGFLTGAHDYYNSSTDIDVPRDNLSPIYINDAIQPPLQESGAYLTETITDHAVSFIEDNKETPFFAYVAYNAVHSPWQVPDKYVQRLQHLAVHHEDRRIFAAMVLAMDDGIGQIIQTLKENGLDDNTLIFFMTDNGTPRGQGIVNPDKNEMKDRGDNRMSNPGPFRGFKGDTYEGGIRVPMVMNWKGHIPAGMVYDKPVISLDIVPTVLASVGKSVETDLDGVNILPHILNEVSEAPHDTLYWRRDRDYAIRIGKWKLAYNDAGSTQRIQLFDMQNDKEEMYDLANQYPIVAQKLQDTFDAWDSKNPEYPFGVTPSNRNKHYAEGHRRSVSEYNHTVSLAEQSDDVWIFTDHLYDSDFYYPSWTRVGGSCQLHHTIDGYLKVDTETYKVGKNALCLSWGIVTTGTWSVSIGRELPRIRAPFSLTQFEKVNFWIYSEERIEKDYLPKVCFQDTKNKKTSAISLSNYVPSGSLTANEWVQIQIPITDFEHNGCNVREIKTFYLTQGVNTKQEHTIWLDDIYLKARKQNTNILIRYTPKK